VGVRVAGYCNLKMLKLRVSALRRLHRVQYKPASLGCRARAGRAPRLAVG